MKDKTNYLLWHAHRQGHGLWSLESFDMKDHKTENNLLPNFTLTYTHQQNTADSCKDGNFKKQKAGESWLT